MIKFKLQISLFIFILISATSVRAQPNIVLIIIDDLNDWTTTFNKSNPIQTPNIDNLAAGGVFFKNAYCSSPACNPSRTSILTGIQPYNSGVYGNATNWRRATGKTIILPQVYLSRGYKVIGTGKIFHHHWKDAFFDPFSFEEFNHLPWPIDQRISGGNLNDTKYYYNADGSRHSKVSPNFDWGFITNDTDKFPDIGTVEWAIDRLKSLSEPFFMAVGIFRPHMPIFSPESYRSKYPLDLAGLPQTKENDLEDIPSGGKKFIEERAHQWNTFQVKSKNNEHYYEEAVQSYKVAATFCDDQVGRFLDSLQASDHAKNTIVVLMSDHGFHLGEKNMWGKFSLWEKSTHVPLIFSGPGIPSKVIETPVSLVDVYPTLMDISKIVKPEHLDGESLVPIINGVIKEHPPVISTYKRGNYAIRSGKFKYIRYKDGSEELYDLDKDPNEWNNLSSTQFNSMRNEMAKLMPKYSAPGFKNVDQPDDLSRRKRVTSHFDFDPSSFKIENVKHEFRDQCEIKIDWTVTPVNLIGGTIYRRENEGEFSPLGTIYPGEQSYTDTSPKRGLYQYKIELSNENDRVDQAFSEWVTISRETCTSIYEIHPKDIFLSYNTTTDLLTISSSIKSAYTVLINDILGKKIHISHNHEENELSIHIPDNTPIGVYCVHLISPNQIGRKKFILGE